MEEQIKCRYFNGYKPCGKNETCNSRCPQLDIPQLRILVVHLEALGAVLRATSILPALKRKFPSSKVTWITKKPATDFFQGNSLVDEVIPFSFEGMMELESMDFDVGIVVDKSRQATGILNRILIDQVYGFISDRETGAIVPATESAKELWGLGLSNQKKFFENQKTENQLMIEAFELGDYRREDPIIILNEQEKQLVNERKKLWQADSFDQPIIGINVGCSNVISYKKLSVGYQQRLITQILKKYPGKVILLGGREDINLAEDIANGTVDSSRIIVSPMDQGIRDGICSVAACDIVLTGDSLGMHMAISLKKWVIAWFGPTCAHEIELYERGVKLMANVGCAPCWKRSCNKPMMCYDTVDPQEFLQGIEKGIAWYRKQSSFKQPLLEICS